MNNSNDEIKDLIKQLKNLQLQQTELLVCLEKARGREARTGPNEEAEANTTKFAIRDKVRIKNPTLFQANQGKITKIGSSHITVETKSGTKILRAPKNPIPAP